MNDFTYSTGCGCQCTFTAESNYRTSRFIPGKSCKIHSRPDQYDARDRFVADGKETMKYAKEWRNSIN